MTEGAYLWGAWMDGSYYDFVTWELFGLEGGGTQLRRVLDLADGTTR